MSSAKVPYPAMPAGTNPAVLNPSPEFKKEVINVCVAILFFLLVYLLLIAAAVALAVACAAGGISLIIFVPKFLTIMIGLGIVGLGVMVLFFLIKFIFKQHKVDRSELLEIKEDEQPELFSFIRKITDETKTPFPKRIYLSADVNACVFYDSGFWSMFFPVRKNLQIGLGLVNCTNVSEFKAILAHEFGHFSQRSMKLGSYVYNVNKVIYNMLYDNTGYGNAIDQWANISGYFAIFAGITIKIVQGIQFILQEVYAVVNKRYMSLSRQMEFHADSVAAYVTGGNHLITSLYRLDAAQISYNDLFNLYNEWLKENYKSENIYPQHKELMQDFAQRNKIKIENGLPVMDAHSLMFLKQNKVVIKDQWASHPETEDREAHLNSLNIVTETLHESAWVVFKNAEALQKKMTEKLYEPAVFKGTPVSLPLSAFREKFSVFMKENNFHPAYKGYYNGRFVAEFNIHEAAALPAPDKSLDTILTDEVLNIPLRLAGLEADVQLLDVIIKGEAGIKTFDFDGEKYEKKHAPEIQRKIEKEINELKKALLHTDREIFLQAYHKMEQGARHKFTEDYQTLWKYIKALEKHTGLYTKFMELLQPLYFGPMEYDEAKSLVNRIQQRELLIKPEIKELLADTFVKEYMDKEDYEKVVRYAETEFTYFNEQGFLDKALGDMQEALNLFINASNSRCFRFEKKLLEDQLNA